MLVFQLLVTIGLLFHEGDCFQKAKVGSSSVSVFNKRIYLRNEKWDPSNLLDKSNTQTLSMKKTPDFNACLSYVGATGIQWTLIYLFLNVLQEFVVHLHLPESFPVTDNTIQTVIVSLFFLFMTLRSRVFSPLDNRRPTASTNDPVFKERKRPSWQPPPVAFPIIWSTIAILRTISSVMVWQTTGTLICPPLLIFLAHLSIGDTWNTINNVEKRLGTAFLGVLFVLASVYTATYFYWTTLPIAGYVLAPSAVWISIATFLVYSIWKLNSEDFGQPSLFPSKEEGPPSNWRLPFTSLDR